ncbi:MAG: hypothetical protein Q9165_006687 [Trypethelium subeluteriae]
MANHEWIVESSTSAPLLTGQQQGVVFKCFSFQKPTSEDLESDIKPCWSLAQRTEINVTPAEIEDKLRAIRSRSKELPMDDYNRLPSKKIQDKIDELVRDHRTVHSNCKWSIAAIETERGLVDKRATEIGKMLVIIQGVQKPGLPIRGKCTLAPDDSSQYVSIPGSGLSYNTSAAETGLPSTPRKSSQGQDNGALIQIVPCVPSGKTKSKWDFNNVISGLLKQEWIATAWEALIAERHGTNLESRPNFQWQSKNDGCLELMQDLQHGHCDDKEVPHESLIEERHRELVETAYRLGITIAPTQQTSTPVFPNDSESIANVDLHNSYLAKSDTEEAGTKSQMDVHADYSSSEDDSYEDDTSSDDDDDDSSISPYRTSTVSRNPILMEQLLPPLREKLINSVLNDVLRSRFDGFSGVRSHAGSDQTTNSSSSGTTAGGLSGARSGGTGSKRGMTGESPSGGDDGSNREDPNKRQKRQSSGPLDPDPIQTNLACPYYKRHPEIYRHKRSCPGPGWPSVARLKHDIPPLHYMVVTDSKQEKAISPNSDQQFEDFDKFYKRELPRHLQRTLAERLKSESEPVQELLIEILAEALPESNGELYQKWQLAQGQVPPSPARPLPEGDISLSSYPAGPSSAPSTLPLRSEAADARLLTFLCATSGYF